jgi:pyruvate/2-oxoglutarate/acetoin dehydrogenase E1 component
VIDVATLKPIDFDTILASVAKTGRCVVVTEAPRHCSIASEIAATLAEHGLLTLLAPVSVLPRPTWWCRCRGSNTITCRANGRCSRQ